MIFLYIYRLFDDSMAVIYPGITGDDLTSLKEENFANWLEEHVRNYF